MMSTRVTSLFFAVAYGFIAALLLFARPESGLRRDAPSLVQVTPTPANDFIRRVE
jgi:hypothetical protein